PPASSFVDGYTAGSSRDAKSTIRLHKHLSNYPAHNIVYILTAYSPIAQKPRPEHEGRSICMISRRHISGTWPANGMSRHRRTRCGSLSPITAFRHAVVNIH